MAKPWTVKNLDPDDSLARNLKNILHTKFREILSHVPAALKGEDIEALHDLRVSTRRLESTLKLFRRCFPKDQYKQEYKTIKEFLSAMGNVREQDVLMQTIQQFSVSLPESERPPVEKLFREHFEQYTTLRRQLNEKLHELRGKAYRARFDQFLETIGQQ